ncbi:MAG: hypothetical protein JWO89_641 [Verrucomicrobiaceae bacterium]|nr:hypothetical protein [Verrucomicrobiaceae bacterium]
MIAMRTTVIMFAALFCMAGVASAQYGYSVQGPPPAGTGLGGAPQYTGGGYSPSSPAYSQANTFDPNMGMGTASYGGPSYTGQQNYPQQGYGPAAMSTVGGGMLTYGQLEIDYMRTTHTNKAIPASDGIAVSLMTELMNPFFLHFGADFSSGSQGSTKSKDYDFTKLSLGGGGHFAITNRLHFTGEIGFLYANLDSKNASKSFSDGAVYIMPGLRFAATDSLELDGHLTATSADKYDGFIFDLGGYYKVFAQMDLGLNVGFGDESTTYKAGVRFRW